MQFISLKSNGVMPFVIRGYEDSIYSQYKKALLEYYHHGDYKPYKEFFMQHYEKIHQDLLRWKA